MTGLSSPAPAAATPRNDRTFCSPKVRRGPTDRRHDPRPLERAFAFTVLGFAAVASAIQAWTRRLPRETRRRGPTPPGRGLRVFGRGQDERTRARRRGPRATPTAGVWRRS